MEKLLKPGNITSQPPILFAWSLFLKTESSVRNAASNRAHIITRTRMIPIIIPIPIILRIHTTTRTDTPTAVTGGKINQSFGFSRSKARGLPIGPRAQPACVKPRLAGQRQGWMG